ncbi:MAG: hypothetical protein ACYTGV_08070 [Planctomycetota bacterium]|jgi:pimeloyl-ACP methyl ester carboxylesterase
MSVAKALPIALWVALAVGCSTPARHAAPERLDKGYAALFVGIMGVRDQHNQFVDQLLDSGLPYAVEVIDWTRGPFLFPMNLRAIERNRDEARAIAKRILDYQDRHPGRPVFLIGFSAGAGVVLLLLEELPEDRKVTSAILLAAAVSPGYNLTRALRHTERGIWNFFSTKDRFQLDVGTTLLGTFDGRHVRSAGLVGFRQPDGLSPEDQDLYVSHLNQVRHDEEMKAAEIDGGHLDWLERPFARDYVMPLLTERVDGRE